jgi:hypothetical protein
MRDDPPLAPDWLRIGTDIIKRGAPPTFTAYNASFELSGHTVNQHDYDHGLDSETGGSGAGRIGLADVLLPLLPDQQHPERGRP